METTRRTFTVCECYVNLKLERSFQIYLFITLPSHVVKKKRELKYNEYNGALGKVTYSIVSRFQNRIRLRRSITLFVPAIINLTVIRSKIFSKHIYFNTKTPSAQEQFLEINTLVTTEQLSEKAKLPTLLSRGLIYFYTDTTQ